MIIRNKSSKSKTKSRNLKKQIAKTKRNKLKRIKILIMKDRIIWILKRQSLNNQNKKMKRGMSKKGPKFKRKIVKIIYKSIKWKKNSTIRILRTNSTWKTTNSNYKQIR